MATRKITDEIFEKGIKSIVGQIGKGYNTRGLASSNLKAIPTGHDDLDILLTKGAMGMYLGGLIEIMGSEGSGKCLTRDTYCFTKSGMLSIEEIFSSEDVPLNAITGFVEKEISLLNGFGKWENTSHLYRNGYGSSLPVRRIYTKDGFEICGTQNHPIKILDSNGHVIWKKLNQIKKGDQVCIVRNTRIWPEQDTLSNREAALLGLLIGNGNFTPPCRIGFTNNDQRIVQHFFKCAKHVFGNDVINKIRNYDDDYHINDSSRINQFKGKHGIKNEKACDKTIPRSIRCATKVAQIEFIKAYFDADGTFQFDRGNMQFSSCSHKLLQQLQLILLNFGVYAYITSSYNQNYDKDYYELELAGKELHLYYQEIGFNQNNKSDPIITFIESDTRKHNTNIDTIPFQNENIKTLYSLIDPIFRNRKLCATVSDLSAGRCNLTYGKLKSILENISNEMLLSTYVLDHFKNLFNLNYIYSAVTRIETYRERTFDFTLPETHSFWSNGFISHNSSLSLRTVGNAQKLGHRCCWIDAEAAFDENIAVLNGVDPTQLIIPELIDTKAVKTSENSLSLFNSAEVLEMIYKSVISNLYGIIVLDSVAGLMPERVLQENFDPNTSGVAEVARSMSMMMGKIAQACKKTETTVIFINQLRDKPGQYYSDPYHTPGGRALKFFSHQRISVQKIMGPTGKVYIEEDGKKELIGHYAKVTIVKNKKAPPPQDGVSIEIPIYYREYFPDDAKKCYDLARQMQVVTSRNGILTWKDDTNVILQIEGESVFLAKLREDKMESQLAAACIVAESGERNQKRKIPIKVSVTFMSLAKKHNSSVSKPVKKRRKAAISLDDED